MRPPNPNTVLVSNPSNFSGDSKHHHTMSQQRYCYRTAVGRPGYMGHACPHELLVRVDEFILIIVQKRKTHS